MTLDEIQLLINSHKKRGVKGNTQILIGEKGTSFIEASDIEGLQEEEITFSSSTGGFIVNNTGISKEHGKNVIVIY